VGIGGGILNGLVLKNFNTIFIYVISMLESIGGLERFL
jgi:hypothetical protein